MSEKYPIIGEDDVWPKILKVLHYCTETDDALEDVIALRKKLEVFSADQIFNYYFERETDSKEEFIWCIASIAYAYFGKSHEGSWYAAQWLLFDIVHADFGKFTDYLVESLPTHTVAELSDLSMEIASDNFDWGFNAHGPFQIYSLIRLRKIAHKRKSERFSLDGKHCFSKSFFQFGKYHHNWRELGIFLETTDAIYFSLATILIFKDDETVDIGSVDDAAEFTLSICDDASLDDLENIQNIRDIVENGVCFDKQCEFFNFSRENERYPVDEQMIEFALGVIAQIESSLNE